MSYYRRIELEEMANKINDTIADAQKRIRVLESLREPLKKYHGKVINCKFGDITINSEKVYYYKSYDFCYLRLESINFTLNVTKERNERFGINTLETQINKSKSELKQMLNDSGNYIAIIHEHNYFLDCLDKAYDKIRKLPGFYSLSRYWR